MSGFMTAARVLAVQQSRVLRCNARWGRCVPVTPVLDEAVAVASSPRRLELLVRTGVG